jgi:hypothetical protein
VRNTDPSKPIYAGDPTQCCIQDHDFNQHYGTCFAGEFDPDAYGPHKKTCPPDTRYITSGRCPVLILDHCRNYTDPGWSNEDGYCIWALKRQLFDKPNDVKLLTPSSIPPIKKDGSYWGRELMTEVFKSFRAAGKQIGSIPGSSTYDSFQDKIYQICKQVPGICVPAIETACQEQNATVNSLVGNPYLMSWCGCYLPPDEYDKTWGIFNIDPECTPVCAKENNIPLVQTDEITPKTCEQSLCIIDDINISIINSNVEGGVQFQQFCGGCENGSTCRCVFSGDSVTAINSNIEGVGGISFSSKCGSTTCYLKKEDQLISFPCGTDELTAYDQEQRIQEEDRNAKIQYQEESNFIYVIMIILIILIIALIIYLIQKR